MPVTVVVGTQWGDEGKAKVIDLLAADQDFVVRYQGGHNAGHTVVVGDQRYALQLVPSGVLYPSVTPVIGNGVVVDLETLVAEMDGLAARGVSCERLLISSLAHLIFPWHCEMDALMEAARGEGRIGTTLKGIGPAYADKVRRIGVRVGEILDEARFAAAVRERGEAASREVEALGGPRLDVAAITDRQMELARRVASHVADTVNVLHGAREAGKSILLEGAQATFLDIDHGTYPFVTSSTPTAGGASAGSGLGPRHIDRVVGIAKAYTTRVGSGPFPSELHGTLGDALVDIGHEYGTVTGRRRRTGWLDTVMLRHAVRVNSLTDIALTKVDVLDTFEEIKVCTGYARAGRPVRGYPDTVAALAEVEPIWETIPGWKTTIAGATSFVDLPASVKRLVEIVESEAGVPVSMIGTGPERDAVVTR